MPDPGIKHVYLDGFADTSAWRDSVRLRRVLQLASESIPHGRDIRVLDVGCGDGAFGVELGRAVGTAQVYGVDISPRALEIARARGLNTRLGDVDEADLALEDASFDLIYCGNLMELVLNPDHLLAELQRLVKPSGRVIVTFPNHAAWASRISLVLGFHPFYDRVSRHYDLGKLFRPVTRGDSTGFVRLFTIRSFSTLASLYGLRVVRRVGAPEPALPRPMRYLDALICRVPSLALQVICILEKAAQR